MSKKRTLADLMDNDFFIDFDNTKAKTERKSLNESLKESKLKEGFYDYDYDLSEDKISEKDLYKALVTDGELVSLNAGNTGEMVSFKDGGVYCDTTYEVTEYDGKFSVTEFYNSDDGESKEGDYYFETDSFETLCAELQRIFPNVLIECKMTEEVEEPDNAVVDCKVNKVIAHSEDEKPVDCLGEKKPLEKPLTEDTDRLRMAAWCARTFQDFYKAVKTGASYKRLGSAAYKALEKRYGITGTEAEDIMCAGYTVWKQRHWDDTNESLKEARSVNELNEGGQTPEAKAWQDANCFKWNGYAVINGKRKSVACTYEPKEINPDTLIASVRRIAAHKLNLIMSECFFLKKPFAWDGNLEITRTEFGAEPEYITTIQIKRHGDRDLSQIPEL